jgi:hypothetical protein
MTNPTRTCACGCGAPVTHKWVRGHSARGVNGYTGPEPIPGPDDPDLYDDIGVLVPDDAEPTQTPGAAQPAEGTAPATAGAGPVTPDEPPAHGRRDWIRQPRPDRPRAPRVTQVTRKDIDAKIGLALTISGSVWAARDPLCGGTFMEQRGEISGALTEIVCQSADLIAWFSGSGGQFMLWLNLAAACWPVGTAIMAHHVYHTVVMDEDGAVDQADAARYAA